MGCYVNNCCQMMTNAVPEKDAVLHQHASNVLWSNVAAKPRTHQNLSASSPETFSKYHTARNYIVWAYAECLDCCQCWCELSRGQAGSAFSRQSWLLNTEYWTQIAEHWLLNTDFWTLVAALIPDPCCVWPSALLIAEQTQLSSQK